MSYFKRLTADKNQLNKNVEISQFTFKNQQKHGIRNQNYQQSIQQFHCATEKINKPYRTIQVHRLSQKNSSNQILISEWPKKFAQIQNLRNLTPLSSTSDTNNLENNRLNTMDNTQSQKHHEKNTKNSNPTKINSSQNTSPLKQQTKIDHQPTENKYTQEFFINLINMMKKFNENQPITKEKKTEPEVQKIQKQKTMKYNCDGYHPSFYSEKQHGYRFHSEAQTPHNINQRRNTNQSLPPYEYFRQPPIIINNIIKQDDRKLSIEENLKNSPKKSSSKKIQKSVYHIDKELEEQENLILKLEQERKKIRKDTHMKSSKFINNNNTNKKIQQYFDTSIIQSYQLKRSMNEQKSFKNTDTNQTIYQQPQELNKFRTTHNSHKKTEQFCSQPATGIKKQFKRVREYNPKQFLNNQKNDSNRNLKSIKKQQITQQKLIKDKQNSVIASQKKQKEEQKRPVFFQLSINQNQENLSLAEAFLKRKKNHIDKFNQNKSVNVNLKKTQKSAEKTKQQLAQIRKDMMKRKTIPSTLQTQNNSGNQTQKDSSINPIQKKQLLYMQTSLSKNNKIKRQPSQELLQRLIYGVKPKIDEKQMKALTQKNYEMLPEVKKRKQQQRKKQQFQKRMLMKKQFEQSLKNRK